MTPSYYLDIMLVPGEDMPLRDLQSALFDLLHKNFATGSKSGIQFALAFPEIGEDNLGHTFRIFAEKLGDYGVLDLDMICRKRLYGMVCHGLPMEVPQGVPFIRYSRKHDQIPEDVRRARIMKKFINPEAREKALAGTHEKRPLDLPYVMMTSCSTSHDRDVRNRFAFYVRTQEALQQATGFNCYGMPLTEGGVPDFPSSRKKNRPENRGRRCQNGRSTE